MVRCQACVAGSESQSGGCNGGCSLENFGPRVGEQVAVILGMDLRFGSKFT